MGIQSVTGSDICPKHASRRSFGAVLYDGGTWTSFTAQPSKTSHSYT